jgi:hypothetical protein
MIRQRPQQINRLSSHRRSLFLSFPERAFREIRLVPEARQDGSLGPWPQELKSLAIPALTTTEGQSTIVNEV